MFRWFWTIFSLDAPDLFVLFCLFVSSSSFFFFQTNSFQLQDVTDEQNVISIARAFPILIGQNVTTAMTAAFNSHLHTRKIFAHYRRSWGEAQIYFRGGYLNMFPAIMCFKNVSQAMLFSEINFKGQMQAIKLQTILQRICSAYTLWRRQHSSGRPVMRDETLQASPREATTFRTFQCLLCGNLQ